MLKVEDDIAINKRILEFLTEIKNAIKENHIRAGQVATGKTLESFEIVKEGERFNLVARDGIENLETGTRPNTVVSIADLKAWVEAKGINMGSPSQLKSLQKRIEQRGSLLYRKGGRKDIVSNVITDDLNEQISKEIEPLLFNLFQSNIKGMFA